MIHNRFWTTAFHFSRMTASAIIIDTTLPSHADDEKILVEPAGGAALASVYSGVARRLQAEGKLSPRLDSLVVIVCGGSNITLAQLQCLKEQLGLQGKETGGFRELQSRAQ